MDRDSNLPSRRIEEAARARDVVERARAAGGSGGALAQAADRLHANRGLKL